jgi:hypothetical protein
MTKWLGRAAALIVALAGTVSFAPVQAGEPELTLLKSYIGSWKGEGTLEGGEKPEPFRCRLSVAKGNEAKINYAGRCTLIDMNLSVSGTIGYLDDKRRYEAAMSSNAGFTGTAVGNKKGDSIAFDLTERQTDKGGNDVRIGSRIILVEDAITVEFEVEFNSSGQLLTASVPFSR